ncbi:winged helix-turn-helix domain-containing protein [Haloarcula sp. S1AR25-5A]|uniref:Winged helix-turn-helix domain-containing protein n=1 Tax=Haloarcula terrestris TaxID=2950533 RepID=A0AAE4F0N2_9EURY|nr:winged helix-turn-helix domain-containing protein [Haloarcula terrestris]MDS0223658.1 winged helix-turn-helix domain-containing protein [Haloarcula terrestris]
MSSTKDSPNTEDSGAYAEDSALTQLLGNGPKVSIIAAFLADPDPEFDYNVTEIADLAGVSRNTVYRHLDDLVDIGVIQKTRESGGSPRYKLNEDNAAAKRMAQLEWDLIDVLYEEE